MYGMRFNWKVLAVVATVAIGLLIATQYATASVLPNLLLILVCPLIMLFMMGSMDHTSEVDRQHRATSGDIPNLPYLKGLRHDEQDRALRRELTKMAWRQEALRHNLERLEAEQKTCRAADPEIATGTR